MLIVRRVPRQGSRVSAAITSLESITALTLAHAAAGGDLPQAGWLLPPAVAAYGASRLVLTRRASIPVVLPGLVALQLFLHAWLVTLIPSSHAPHPGHHSTVDMLGLTGPMLWAHVAAGVVTAFAWLIRNRVVDVLVAWAEPGTQPTPTLRRPATAGILRPRPRGLFLACAPTRGPPVGLRSVA